MSKHTPGPWEIVPIESVGPGESLGRADIVAWDDDREGYEVIFHAVDIDDERSKANACMATAATDMFAALEAVVSVADRSTVEFDLARAAIAKARGEA